MSIAISSIDQHNVDRQVLTICEKVKKAHEFLVNAKLPITKIALMKKAKLLFGSNIEHCAKLNGIEFE